jgi:hypothetical protein
MINYVDEDHDNDDTPCTLDHHDNDDYKDTDDYCSCHFSALKGNLEGTFSFL